MAYRCFFGGKIASLLFIQSLAIFLFVTSLAGAQEISATMTDTTSVLHSTQTSHLNPVLRGTWCEDECPPSFVHELDRCETNYMFSALARSYYYNDQRLQWTGQEETFGAEAVLGGAMMRNYGGWQTGVEGELFINQPYDRNILVDTPERQSYLGNFNYETLEISQLFIEASRGDLAFSFGKRWTPFGRTYFPLHTNLQFDAPFIRTEAINWRETGFQMDYTPGNWDCTLAIVNGSEELDTNSSKAVVGRIGVKGDWYAFGTSVKWQDGIGSEDQKLRKNHFGFDMMVRSGGWSLSGEIIYDEYGFRRDFDPLDITWGRSVYHREQFGAERLRGIGYYVNLNYQGQRWSSVLNYGAFHPRFFTGDQVHDRVTHRSYAKLIRHIAPGFDAIGTVLVENDVPNAQAGRTRQGLMLYGGLEYRF